MRVWPGTAAAARWVRGNGPILALAAAGALAPLARAWLSGLTVLHRDSTGQFAPLRWLAGTALREGRLPLWNPHCATGMPYLAETTHGVLHPLSVAVAFLFPSDGLDPLVGAWIASAALGAFALARSLGASRSASLVAAFAYGLSGWTLSMTSNLIGLAGAGSAPWVVAGLRVAGRDRDPLGFALGVAGVAAGALAGDVQTLAVASAVGFLLAGEAGGWRGALLSLGAAANGALLAGVQLAPSWSFLQQTDRAFPLPAAEKDQWDLAPWRLVELLSPGFFTRPADGMGPAPVFLALGHPTLHELPLAESVFVGGAVLLLAAAGARASRTGRVLLGCALGVAWLAMGRHLGARALQDLLPVAQGWRYGEKYLTTVTLCLAALAALGADRLVGDPSAARRWRFGALYAAAGVLCAWLLMAPGAAGGLLGWLGAPAAPDIRSHLRTGLPHALIALLALAPLLWLAARGRPALARGGLVLVMWLAGLAASGYALRPGSVEARLETQPPRLEAEAPGPRVLRLGEAAPRVARPDWDAIDLRNFQVAATYTPNFNARSRVDAFGADTGLMPIRWRVLTDALVRTDLVAAARRYGVTHALLPTGLRLDWARAELDDPRTGMTVWALPHRPWAVFPDQIVGVNGPDEAIAAILRFQREGRRTAVIEAEGPIPIARGRVLTVARERERLEVVAEADGDTVLIVNDAYWPGWRAFVDGGEVGIFAADGLVRAVPFPPGRHTLVMRYEPPELGLGLLLTAAGVGVLAVVCYVLRRRRAPDAAPEATRGADVGGAVEDAVGGASRALDEAALTVVVPVWNEGRNLRAWWSAAAPHLPPGSRVLIVHDTAEDDSLPVVLALAAEGAPIEPLRSRGTGFPDAMLTGLLAAPHGPVLVTMADLCDDLGVLPAMLEAFRAGAELVVGSRHMPGGSLVGAHPVKALLSRWGSRVLYRLARFPVRDASNAFRLYDAALLQRLRIDDAVGFEIVLALLVAAWKAGARVVEVPVTWRARGQGRSRFRFRWIPRYARLWGVALVHGLGARLAARGRAGGAR